MSECPPDRRWVRAAESLWRTVPGHLVLSDTEGSTLEVTGPGAAMWHLLSVPTKESDLLNQLAEMYGVPITTIRANVTNVLEELEDRGHVHRAEVAG